MRPTHITLHRHFSKVEWQTWVVAARQIIEVNEPPIARQNEESPYGGMVSLPGDRANVMVQETPLLIARLIKGETGPTCGHRTCSQRYIDTGETECLAVDLLTELVEWADNQHMEGYEAREWVAARVFLGQPAVPIDEAREDHEEGGHGTPR